MQKLKRYSDWIFLFFILFICVFSPEIYAISQTYFVKTVLDGDTIILENGERVRYNGVNTPEIAHKDRPGEPFGEQAKKRNAELVLHKSVRLEIAPEQEKDRYGRLLADVFLTDGTNAGEMLVSEGLAYTCRYGRQLDTNLLRAQRRAMEQRRGIWASDTYTAGQGPFPANTKSGIFHDSDCSFGRSISPRNKVIFKDKKQAFWDGFCPCKKCNP